MHQAGDLGDRADRAQHVRGSGSRRPAACAAPSSRSRSARSSSKVSGSTRHSRSTTPRAPSARQGPMFDSWSKSVTMISSPGWNWRAMAARELLQQRRGRWRRAPPRRAGARRSCSAMRRAWPRATLRGGLLRRRVAGAVLDARGEQVVAHAVGHAREHLAAAGIVQDRPSRPARPGIGGGRRRVSSCSAEGGHGGLGMRVSGGRRRSARSRHVADERTSGSRMSDVDQRRRRSAASGWRRAPAPASPASAGPAWPRRRRARCPS